MNDLPMFPYNLSDDLFEIVVHQLDTIIDMMYLGSNTLMCTSYNFLCSKVRCIHTSTVNRSHSYSGKNYGYAAYILFYMA